MQIDENLWGLSISAKTFPHKLETDERGLFSSKKGKHRGRAVYVERDSERVWLGRQIDYGW